MQTVEIATVTRMFGSWSVEIPVDFDVSFEPQGYWHARRGERWVSMTGFAGPPGADSLDDAVALLSQVPLRGVPIDSLPSDLIGRAVVRHDRIAGSGRQHVLQGVLAAPGRLLLVTITGGDPAWATATWQSIRHHRPWTRARGRFHPRRR